VESVGSVGFVVGNVVGLEVVGDFVGLEVVGEFEGANDTSGGQQHLE